MAFLIPRKTIAESFDSLVTTCERAGKETGGSESGDRRIVGYTALYVLHSRLLTAKNPPDVPFYRRPARS